MTSQHCCGTEQKYSCTVLHECMSSHCRCLNEYVQGDCCRSAQCASWDPPPEFFLQNKVGYDVHHVGRPYAVIACRLSRVGDAAIVRSHIVWQLSTLAPHNGARRAAPGPIADVVSIMLADHAEYHPATHIYASTGPLSAHIQVVRRFQIATTGALHWSR